MGLLLWEILSLDPLDQGWDHGPHREGVRTVMRMGGTGARKGKALASAGALRLLGCTSTYNSAYIYLSLVAVLLLFRLLG